MLEIREPRTPGLSSFRRFVKRMSNIVLASVDEVRDLRGGLGLHPGDHVRVLLERESGRLVAETLADHLDRDAGLEGQRRVRMAEVSLLRASPRRGSSVVENGASPVTAHQSHVPLIRASGTGAGRNARISRQLASAAPPVRGARLRWGDSDRPLHRGSGPLRRHASSPIRSPASLARTTKALVTPPRDTPAGPGRRVRLPRCGAELIAPACRRVYAALGRAAGPRRKRKGTL
jgi:hypothetical protein